MKNVRLLPINKTRAAAAIAGVVITVGVHVSVGVGENGVGADCGVPQAIKSITTNEQPSAFGNNLL